MIKIKDKVVWVTGASSGIGEALAKEFSKRGARLILSSRKANELERVKSELVGGDAKKATILPIDLSHSDKLADKARAAMAIFGRIDILVHSGGISQRSMALDTDEKVLRRVMEINFFAAVRLTQEVLPSMIENGYGHIVPISSLVGKFGTPYRSGYAASKHALHGYFESLRAENYKKNIHVTIAIPGFIRTNISLNALTQDGKALNQMDEAQAKGMDPEQCARVIVNGITRAKNEVLVGGKEKIGVYLKRFFPAYFARFIRKAKVR